MTLLERLRIDALLTVEQLADETGVSSRTIRRLEAGHGAHVATLRKLSKRFDDVSASDLLLPAPVQRTVAA